MKFALGKGIDHQDEEKKYGKKHLVFASAAIGGALVLSLGIYAGIKHSNDANASSEFAGSVVVKRDACKLFTPDDAKKVLGKGAEASPNNASAASPKATVSTCSYSSGAKKAEDLVALTLLVRVSNKIQARQAFELAKAENAETVKNLGDEAYFNPSMSQLNVLKGDTWVIIASTKGTAGKGSVDVPKRAAAIVLKRL